MKVSKLKKDKSKLVQVLATKLKIKSAADQKEIDRLRRKLNLEESIRNNLED